MADQPEDQTVAEALAADKPAARGADSWDAASDTDSVIGSERILNQDEIDSLLGFDLSDDDAS